MSNLVQVDSLRGIVMRGPDVVQTRNFYEESWGLTVAAEEDGAVYFRGTGPEPFVYGLTNSPVYGIDYISFGVASRDKLDALHKQAVRAGASVLDKPGPLSTPGGGYGFTILDPDGRRLRISADVEMDHARGDEVAKPRTVTHVVLNSPKFEQVQAFFENVLGFKVSDFSANQMVFLRCSSDHHAIALNRGQYPSINHVAFEMPSIDSMMRGIGRMKKKGQAPAWGPGRHGPGNIPFAYFVSPSGFVIEFTTEVMQLDDSHTPLVWSRTEPENMDVWMTAGPPTPAMRAVMAGRPDPGFPSS